MLFLKAFIIIILIFYVVKKIIKRKSWRKGNKKKVYILSLFISYDDAYKCIYMCIKKEYKVNIEGMKAKIVLAETRFIYNHMHERKSERKKNFSIYIHSLSALYNVLYCNEHALCF